MPRKPKEARARAKYAGGATGSAARTGGVGPRRLCATMPRHQTLLELDPGFRDRQHDIEHAFRARLASGAARLAGGPITIPVVVHVVYNTSAQNISIAQVKSQIAVLNKDFRAKNADAKKVPAVWTGLVTDARINFKLASTDPSGKPTKGITRTKTSETFFGDDDSVKFTAQGGIDAWPTDRYLNIWVCNLDPWLGYAQFPGGDPASDGVVILHTAFGTKGTAAAPFNLGRTATHEIGHFFNLRHIWADTEDCSSTDFVDDTPNAAGPNYHQPTFPSVSCDNGPNGDMFVNYMDYVDDVSMFMFTAQQVVRMSSTLEGPRKALR